MSLESTKLFDWGNMRVFGYKTNNSEFWIYNKNWINVNLKTGESGLLAKLVLNIGGNDVSPEIIMPRSVYLVRQTNYDWIHKFIPAAITDTFFETIEENTNFVTNRNEVRNFIHWPTLGLSA